MKVLIEIECDNAAFEDNPDVEFARILDTCKRATSCVDVFGAIQTGSARHFSHTLQDINGNKVGKFEVTK
jgi:hypothetical protein